MNKFIFMVLILFSMQTMAIDFPSVWPRNLSDTYADYSPNRITVAWPTTTGKFYCGTGTLVQIMGVLTKMPRPFDSEAFLGARYLDRNKETIVTRELRGDDLVACEKARLSLIKTCGKI